MEKQILLKPSLEAINSFNRNQDFIIEVEGFEYKGKEHNNQEKINRAGTFSIEKQEIGFQFDILLQDYFLVVNNHKPSAFGLDKEIILIRNKGKAIEKKLFIEEKSITNFSCITGSPQKMSGNLSNLSTEKIENLKDCYFRLLIPINETEAEFNESSPTYLIRPSEPLKVDIKGFPFDIVSVINAKILEKDIVFFDFRIESHNFICIDILNKVDFQTFKKYTDVIRLAYAFLSGKYYRDEVYYLSSSEQDFSTIDNIYYTTEENSIYTKYFKLISSYFDAFNPEYVEYHNNSDIPIDVDYPSVKFFADFCKKILDEETLFGTIFNLVEGVNIVNPVLQASIFYIALESITSLITKDMKLITNQEAWGLLKNDLQKCLEVENWQKVIDIWQKKDILFTQQRADFAKEKITNKLQSLNGLPQSLKLAKPFEIYCIKLEQSEKQLIENRNKSLHGNFSMQDIEKKKLDNLSLCLLISMLVLKYCEFNGYIIDIHKFATSIENDNCLRKI
jgi:hypothetical protein